jgi:hypothetical protein
MGWTERREKIYFAISEAFSAKTSIGKDDFVRIYIERDNPPPISDFESQYIPDHETLEEVLEDLAELTGLDNDRVKAHYDRRESFVQFAEHLLRIRSGGGGGGSS